MVPEEVLELRVPVMVTGTGCPLEEHRFDVVIENLLGIAAEILKSAEVALDEGIDVIGESKFHISHSGIPEDHAEAIQPPLLLVHVQVPAFSPVDLCLNAGFGLIPVDGRNTPIRSDLPDVVLEDCVISQ